MTDLLTSLTGRPRDHLRRDDRHQSRHRGDARGARVFVRGTNPEHPNDALACIRVSGKGEEMTIDLSEADKVARSSTRASEDIAAGVELPLTQRSRSVIQQIVVVPRVQEVE